MVKIAGPECTGMHVTRGSRAPASSAVKYSSTRRTASHRKTCTSKCTSSRAIPTRLLKLEEEHASGSGWVAQDVDRRVVLLAGMAMLSTVEALRPSAAQAVPLAPLGDVKRIGGDKLTGRSPEEIKDILLKDLSEGMYFVTGNLTREIFADDCSFVDPTNAVTGLSKYVTALGILFDPEWSKVQLLDIKVTGPNTIEADWKLGGWLKKQYFPWNAKVEPFIGHTVYTLNNDGIIQQQNQTWSISGFEALRETFTPVSGERTQLL